MTGHHHARGLLALSAAGLLDAEGERRLRAHAATCEDCTRELDLFATLAADLRTFPFTPPPPDLLVRTQTLLAAEADRRQGARLALAAASCAAVLLASAFVILYAILGNSGVLPWLAWSSVLSLMGAAAAVVLALHRPAARSSL